MTDSRQPYKFDFFDRLVAIHFPTGGRLFLSTTSIKSLVGTTQPNCVRPSFTLGRNQTLIDRLESCVKATIPAHDVLTTLYFVWCDGILPVPSLADYNLPIASNPSPYDLYASQIPWDLDIGSEHPPTDYVPLNGDLAMQTNAAALLNAKIAAHPGGSFTVYQSDGTPISIIPTVCFVSSIVLTVHVPATSTATFTGRYLFKVPRAETVLLARFTGVDSSTLEADVFHQNVSRMSQLQPPPDDTASASRTGDALYTITTERPDPDEPAFTVAVGVTGGGGGGG